MMLPRLDRYMLRCNLGPLAALIAVALALLTLERLIRITDLIAGSDRALQAAARMLVNLLPHYLGIALPGALLVAVIISVERLSRSGEMVAILASGVSLYRIARPFAALGVVLALASILNSGFVQPLARYKYREVVHELRQSSIVAAFKERKFVQFEDKVVWTSRVDFSGRNLGETFIIETAADGARRFISSRDATLHDRPGGVWVIDLRTVMLGELPATIENRNGDRIMTESASWRLPNPLLGYRERGDDQREFTLGELLGQVAAGPDAALPPETAMAAVHDRLARAALLVVLPFIGVVLGLNLTRGGRSGGLVAGVVLLVLAQKLLEYGLEVAQRGAVPAWAGSWPVVVLVAVLAVVMFRRAAGGRTILPALPAPGSWRHVAAALAGPNRGAPGSR